MRTAKRVTWTFEPNKAAKALVSRAIRQMARKKEWRGKNLRGLRTLLVNEAITSAYAKFAGKREAAS